MIQKISLIFVFLLLTWTKNVMAVEEPHYSVLYKQDNFEVREYPPMLIAKTIIKGDMSEASRKGFQIIADYIFGNNQSSNTEETTKISMTAPVSISPDVIQSIHTPVTIKPTLIAEHFDNAQIWQVSFVMPSEYNLQTIPKPNNPSIQLIELPTRYLVINRYSGLNTNEKITAKIDELSKWAHEHAFVVIGEAQLARYNPPWTLPMFRRNEIFIEINKPN